MSQWEPQAIYATPSGERAFHEEAERGWILTLHAIGAHYTYTEVPFGFWLQHAFGLSRNPVDRLVHFDYGFLLVYPLRHLLMRLAGVKDSGRTICRSAACSPKADYLN